MQQSAKVAEFFSSLFDGVGEAAIIPQRELPQII
jgi:hypothetical protein